jgi:IS605 OrfB family transposase
MSHVERKLYAALCRGHAAHELKSTYLKEYGITARQFNAIRVTLEGKIASIKERQKARSELLKTKIATLEACIRRLNPKSRALAIHRKKRRLHLLLKRQERLEQDISLDKTSLCFGSKKLFRSQFDPVKNGFASYAEWKKAWIDSRSRSFFCLGSKDETCGNQTVQAILQEDGKLTLKLRLPNALSRHGKFLTIKDVYFSYGHEHIVAALHETNSRVAICYRFVLDHKGWTIFVTLPIQKPTAVTRANLGVVGVDINADHLAVVVTDRFGNPIRQKRLPLNTYGKSRTQAKALIGDVTKSLVSLSEQTAKPLVIENLSFEKKKRSLRDSGDVRYARMLSSFSYSSITQAIRSRACRCGIEVHEVNPAFTSIIGRAKFSRRYGLSIHGSAALCIGRRFLGFSEKLPRHRVTMPDGKGGFVALPLPVRNRGKHVWSSWRLIQKRLPAMHAAHPRASKRRSSDEKPLACCDTQKVLEIVGETPTREPTTTLLGCRI